jgi:hypothetical protein
VISKERITKIDDIDVTAFLQDEEDNGEEQV